MGDWTPPSKRFSELSLRFLSAAVLAPCAIWVIWAGGWWLAATCALFGAVMATEWSVMSEYRGRILFGIGVVTVCLTLPLVDIEYTLLQIAVTAIAVFLSAKGTARNRGAAMFGVLYVSAMVVSLYLLRANHWDGRAIALILVTFVWASDGAAYFSGRGIGGPKLLPKESPNKTWAGAIGAVIACAIGGAIAAKMMSAPYGAWILVGICVSIVAQSGDLFESGLKRRFGVKDSGAILPGHGGVLDRVDGLGAACLAALLVLAANPALVRTLGIHAVGQ